MSRIAKTESNNDYAETRRKNIEENNAKLSQAVCNPNYNSISNNVVDHFRHTRSGALLRRQSMPQTIKKLKKKTFITVPTKRSARILHNSKKKSSSSSAEDSYEVDSSNNYSSDSDCDKNYYYGRKKSKSSSQGLGRLGQSIANTPSMNSYKSLPYCVSKKFDIIGSIPGVPVGSLFPYRNDCRSAGIHQPLVAGISGHTIDGCHSIAINGGYPEDRDDGYEIVFTGCGGRDLKGTKDNPKNLRTAPQTRDMERNRFNQLLLTSVSTGLPIRVVRGPKCRYEYAPIGCYRYDGLYQCVMSTYDVGESGFKVFRFKCTRFPDQPPLESLPRSMDDNEFKKIIEEVIKYKNSLPTY